MTSAAIMTVWFSSCCGLHYVAIAIHHGQGHRLSMWVYCLPDMEEASEGPGPEQYVGVLPGAVLPHRQRGRSRRAQAPPGAPQPLHQPGGMDG